MTVRLYLPDKHNVHTLIHHWWVSRRVCCSWTMIVCLTVNEVFLIPEGRHSLTLSFVVCHIHFTFFGISLEVGIKRSYCDDGEDLNCRLNSALKRVRIFWLLWRFIKCFTLQMKLMVLKLCHMFKKHSPHSLRNHINPRNFDSDVLKFVICRYFCTTMAWNIISFSL